MTLILNLDLDMVKMYLHTKNEVSMSSGSKVIAGTDRNTDTQTDTNDRKHYLPAYAGGNYMKNSKRLRGTRIEIRCKKEFIFDFLPVHLLPTHSLPTNMFQRIIEFAREISHKPTGS